MGIRHSEERRLGNTVDIKSKFVSGGKGVALYLVKQVWGASGNGVKPLLVGVQIRQSGEQSPGVGVAGVVVNLVNGSLFDDFARVHNVHEVGNLCHNAEVVGDVDNGNAQLVLNLLDKLQYLRLNGNVQSGGGLVADEQVGVAGKGDCDNHSLAHTAGKLVRITLKAFFRIGNAHHFKQLNGAALCLRLWGVVMPNHALHNLSAYGHGGVQGGHGVLKHHCNALSVYGAAHLLFGEGEQVYVLLLAVFVFIGKHGFAGDNLAVGIKNTHGGFYGYGFAGAGFAHYGDGFALANGKIHSPQGVNHSCSGGKVHGQIFNLQNKIIAIFVHKIRPPLHIFLLGVKSVAQSVRHKVEAEHEQRKHNKGRKYHIRVRGKALVGIGNKGAEGSHGRRNTESHKGEERLGENRVRYGEHGLGDNLTYDVRHNLLEDYTHGRSAEGLGGKDKFLLLELEHLSTGDTAHGNPAGNHQRDYNCTESGAEHEYHQGDYDKVRYGVEDFGAALHNCVHAPAEIAGNKSVGQTENNIHRHGDHCDIKAYAGSLPHAGENITAEVVGAEPIVNIVERAGVFIHFKLDVADLYGLSAVEAQPFKPFDTRRQVLLSYILLAVGVAADMRTDYRENNNNNDEEKTDYCALVPNKAYKRILPIALGGKVGVHMGVYVVVAKLKGVFRKG